MRVNSQKAWSAQTMQYKPLKILSENLYLVEKREGNKRKYEQWASLGGQFIDETHFLPCSFLST